MINYDNVTKENMKEQCQINVDSMVILRQYIEEKI